MKKLFTLVALLACFLGAKAEWVQDVKQDYSTYQGFPFYVMGYVPEWVDGVMTDYGSAYRYETQANLDGDGDGKWKDGESSVGTTKTNDGTEYQKVTGAGPYWHQYHLSGNFTAELDGTYVVKAMVKASEQCTIDVDCAWGWSAGQSLNAKVAIGTDWQEVEWEYNGVGGTTCWVTAKPGTCAATIEWKYVIVGHDAKQQKPVEWVELLSNGDASKSWSELGLADVAFTDAENSNKVCAWGKVNQGDPFPATIEDNVFVVHATECPDPTAGESAWDNQFWIMSPKELKVGMSYQVRFKYKASQNAKTNTQMHSIQPSDYLHWAAVGDVTFTTDWQDFENVAWVVEKPQNDRPIYSIAFNLNAEVKTATDFYFDNLSIKEMKLEEGYFVAGCNTDEGLEYDLDNAIPFESVQADNYDHVATVGAKGAYVNEIMISTIRGNDAAFKANTLKPDGAITNDPDNWLDYKASSLAKLKLPGAGIWKVYLDTEYKTMAFEMIEGTVKEPVAIVTNPTEIVVNALERDWKPAKDDGTPQDGEEGIGEGQPWDNQFWMIANRVLDAGEETVVKFQYKAAKPATVSTQTHAAPGGYIHWAAIGNVEFTTDWQDFSADFKIPDEAAGKSMKSIAFNLSELKAANDYYFKNFQWYLKGDEDGKTLENLIDATGNANFATKVKGGDITQGITNVVDNKKASAVIYNLSGQRVSKDYKGIVVTNGKKVVNK